MDTTTNYGLSKPDYGDSPDIEVLGQNADIVDTELKKAQDHRENASNPHKVMADQVGAINPNLLINAHFPVWQRGTSFTGIGMDKYLADRWRLDTSDDSALETVTVSKVNDGMHVSIGDAPNLVLVYTFEDFDWAKIEGKMVTLSYSIDNETKTDTFTITNSESYPKSLAFLVENGNKTEFTINWVKLELGSVATPFSPRPYAEELALCQRYFRDLAGSYRMSFYSTDYVEFGIPQLHDMRIAPTLIVSGTQGNDWVVTNTHYGQIGFDWALGVTGYRDIIATKTNHGQTDAQLMIHPGYVFADAEIY